MKTVFGLVLLSLSLSLSGCGSGSNSNVMEDVDQEAITSYEDAIAAEEAAMSGDPPEDQ